MDAQSNSTVTVLLDGALVFQRIKRGDEGEGTSRRNLAELQAVESALKESLAMVSIDIASLSKDADRGTNPPLITFQVNH